MSHALFDTALLRQRCARWKAQFAAHDFLYQAMAGRIEDRLEDIARTFPLALALDPHGVVRPHPRVGQWARHEDEEQFPFAPETFDAVVACGVLHWANDLPGLLARIHAALKPDGLFLAIFPGGETLNELRDAIMHASIAAEGGASPRISPMVEMRDAGMLLQRARFALPVVDSETLNVRYADTLSLMRDLRGMGEANALLARTRVPLKRATLAAIAETYQRLYGGADGRISATFELITLTAWKPHASQPQPLKRGSGKMHLREILG